MESFFNSGGRAAITYTVLFWVVNLPLCVLDFEGFSIMSMSIIPLIFEILYTIFERKYNKEKFKIYNLSFFATTFVFAVVIFILFYFMRVVRNFLQVFMKNIMEIICFPVWRKVWNRLTIFFLIFSTF